MKYDIIWPFYKDFKYFFRCIKQINNQSILATNLIFINDGNNFSFLEDTLRKSLNSKINLIYIKNPKNIGAALSLEQNFKKIRSEYFYNIATDDLVSRFFIEKSLKPLVTRKSVAFIFSNSIYKIEKNKRKVKIKFPFFVNNKFYSSKEVINIFKKYQFKIYHNTIIFNSKIFLKKNLFKEIYGKECDMINLIYLSFKYGFIYLNKELAHFIIRKGQQGKEAKNIYKQIEILKILKKRERGFYFLFTKLGLHFDIIPLGIIKLLFNNLYEAINIKWFLRSFKFYLWKKIRYIFPEWFIIFLFKYFK